MDKEVIYALLRHRRLPGMIQRAKDERDRAALRLVAESDRVTKLDARIAEMEHELDHHPW